MCEGDEAEIVAAFVLGGERTDCHHPFDVLLHDKKMAVEVKDIGRKRVPAVHLRQRQLRRQKKFVKMTGYTPYVVAYKNGELRIRERVKAYHWNAMTDIFKFME